MADPESATRLPRGMALRHMCLDAKKRVNEFTWAKQKGLVLADYAGATHWQARLEERQEALRKEREAAAEAQRKQAEQEARERARAEFEALPEHRKLIVELERAMEAFPTPEQRLQKARFEEFLRIVGPLMTRAQEWDQEARNAVADAIEAQFERLGWAPGGVKPDKRKKQEKRRRDKLERLRKG
jgi:hypothetical protein